MSKWLDMARDALHNSREQQKTVTADKSNKINIRPEELETMTLSEFKNRVGHTRFDGRTYNKMSRNGLKTIADLKKLSANDLNIYYGIGHKGKAKIEDLLADYGMSLKKHTGKEPKAPSEYYDPQIKANVNFKQNKAIMDIFSKAVPSKRAAGRYANVAARMGINSIEDFAKYTELELYHTEGLAQKGIEVIRKILAKRGLRFMTPQELLRELNPIGQKNVDNTVVSTVVASPENEESGEEQVKFYVDDRPAATWNDTPKAETPEKKPEKVHDNRLLITARKYSMRMDPTEYSFIFEPLAPREYIVNSKSEIFEHGLFVERYRSCIFLCDELYMYRKTDGYTESYVFVFWSRYTRSYKVAELAPQPLDVEFKEGIVGFCIRALHSRGLYIGELHIPQNREYLEYYLKMLMLKDLDTDYQCGDDSVRGTCAPTSLRGNSPFEDMLKDNGYSQKKDNTRNDHEFEDVL